MIKWFKVIVLTLSLRVSFPLEVRVRRRGRVTVIVVVWWRRRVPMIAIMRGTTRWEKWSFKWPRSGQRFPMV